jgi:hypothetical protein
MPERQTLSQFKAKQSQRVSTTHGETTVLTIQQTSCMQLGGDHVPSWVCTTPSYMVGKTQLETENDMQLEQVQCALFAAYDIRNAMSSAEKRQPTENDTYGQSLNQVIDFLEALEDELEDETTEGVQS